MVYNGKPYFLMEDLGVPLFLETPISAIIVENPRYVPLEKPLKKAIARGWYFQVPAVGKTGERVTSPSASRRDLAGHDHKKIYAAMSQAGKDRGMSGG